MTSKFKRALETLKNKGLKTFCLKFLSGMDIYRRVLLLEISLQDEVPEIETPQQLSINLLQKAEVENYTEFRYTDQLNFFNSETHNILNRLESGHRCFVARSENMILSNTWTSTERVTFKYCDRELTLMSDEVYMYDSFTRPEFRGKGISAAVKSHIIKHFKAERYERMIVGIIPDNAPSLRVNLKVGFQPFATIGYLKIGIWRKDFYREHKRIE